ncbi:POU domain, class 6, transcription factor 1 isoform X3 [Arapaima gigas]
MMCSEYGISVMVENHEVCFCTPQVIGTLPFLVNPASLTAGAAASALPAQGLQVQTMSPQLVLNAQGQIIATIGSTATSTPTSASVIPKPSVPLAKTTTQGQVVTVTQAPVVIAPQPSAVKTVTSLASPVPITCGDSPTVGQLVNSIYAMF